MILSISQAPESLDLWLKLRIAHISFWSVVVEVKRRMRQRDEEDAHDLSNKSGSEQLKGTLQNFLHFCQD